jgi:hypothetical protein
MNSRLRCVGDALPVKNTGNGRSSLSNIQFTIPIKLGCRRLQLRCNFRQTQFEIGNLKLKFRGQHLVHNRYFNPAIQLPARFCGIVGDGARCAKALV